MTEGRGHDGWTHPGWSHDGRAPPRKGEAMELTPHLEAIRVALDSLIASDEALASAFERMARPIEATLQLRLLDVLGDAALELTEQVPAGHAGLRGSGRHRRAGFV